MKHNKRYFKIMYADGTCRIVTAHSPLDIVERFDLANKENLKTKIIEVSRDDAVIF